MGKIECNSSEAGFILLPYFYLFSMWFQNSSLMYFSYKIFKQDRCARGSFHYNSSPFSSEKEPTSSFLGQCPYFIYGITSLTGKNEWNRFRKEEYHPWTLLLYMLPKN